MSPSVPLDQLNIARSVDLSHCGRYRWSLTRTWDADLHKPWLGWIMLNPSTADADTDDPTIRRCMRFAHTWGYAGISVMNLFNLRATDPSELEAVADPIAALPLRPSFSHELLGHIFEVCPMVMAAWGSHTIVRKHGMDATIRALCSAQRRSLYCLAMNDDGQPRHPLYVKADSTAALWFDGAVTNEI